MSKIMQNAPLGAFCNTSDLHKAITGIENQFLVFFLSGRVRQVLLYNRFGLSGEGLTIMDRKIKTCQQNNKQCGINSLMVCIHL